MKTIRIFSVMLFTLISVNSFAQKNTVVKDSIKVWGNCGMCKKKIEKAAKTAGAVSASWSEETQQLKVAYSPAKTSNQKIEQAVANVGYDTQNITADANAYKKLDGCCKYDRKPVAPQQ